MIRFMSGGEGILFTEVMNDLEVKTYPIGHFDIYEGEYFEKAIEEKITFLEKHLELSAA